MPMCVFAKCVNKKWQESFWRWKRQTVLFCFITLSWWGRGWWWLLNGGLFQQGEGNVSQIHTLTKLCWRPLLTASHSLMGLTMDCFIIHVAKKWVESQTSSSPGMRCSSQLSQTHEDWLCSSSCLVTNGNVCELCVCVCVLVTTEESKKCPRLKGSHIIQVWDERAMLDQAEWQLEWCKYWVVA